MSDAGRRTVTDVELRVLAPLCSTRSVSAGTAILRVGDAVGHAYIVREGQVALCHQHPILGRHVIAIKRSGDLFADGALLMDIAMPWDAIATRPTHLLELDGPRLITMLRQSPELALRWLGFLGERLIAERRRLVAMTTTDLSGRVAHALLTLQEPEFTGRRVVNVSHHVLAQLLGARRQSVSRVVRRFRSQGLVRSGYRSIQLDDLEALQAIAAAPAEHRRAQQASV